MCRLTLRVFALVVAVALVGSYPAAAEAVKAWQGRITIPTYPWGPDNVDPQFSELGGPPVYPYPMQDYLSQTKEDRTYRTLVLENAYLKVTCLPDLGGRIYSVLDKTRNQPMFYLNHVIKPGLIGLRGAWITGGVEWNRGPEGHTVTDVSPVDALTVRHADGSASLVVGTTEENFGTRWTVELTLHPGKAYLDEHIRLFNPTDGVHTYYFWNNTSFPCGPGTRFMYPMTLGTDHSGTHFFHWPIDHGRDLTWLKNYMAPTSIFAYQCTFNFFGAYDVDRDRGIVDYADHRAVPGKKAWTWGQSDAGLMSQKALTDRDGPYIEVQSGPLPTQSDFGLLLPHQSVAWEEWWYPVHGLGTGFEYATKDVAVQALRRADQGKRRLELRILATGEYPGAAVEFRQQGKLLARRAAALSPRQAAHVVLSPAPAGPIKVRIVGRTGAVLAAYTTPLPIPVKEPPAHPAGPAKAAGHLTADAWYAKALALEKHLDRAGARAGYLRALKLDPKHVPSLKALGVLDLETGWYDQAESRFEKATQAAPGDGWAWYWLGVADLDLGRLDAALACGATAQKAAATASVGCDLSGRAAMRMGDYAAALKWFAKAVKRNPDDTRAQDHRLLALYAQGKRQKLMALAGARIEESPLAAAPRVALALLTKASLPLFVKRMDRYMGDDNFEFQEILYMLEDLGLKQEAVALGKAAVGRLLRGERVNPITYYDLAYLAGELKDPAAAGFLTMAGAWPSDYVFPSRLATLPVLRYAVTHKPGDAKAHLYLGDLYAGLGRIEEAVSEWGKAAALDPSLSEAQRNLGLAAWKKEGALGKAAGYYRKAVAARPEDQQLYLELARILIAESKRAEAVTVLERTPRTRPWRGDVTVLLARTYVDVGRYDDAIRLLERERFSNRESNTETWQVFVRAHLKRGEQRFAGGRLADALADFNAALTYPENLGVGRPAHPQDAAALYWKGKALAGLKRPGAAHAAWRAGAGEAPGSAGQNAYRKRCEEALKAGSGG